MNISTSDKKCPFGDLGGLRTETTIGLAPER
jgi:hypothetical protein